MRQIVNPQYAECPGSPVSEGPDGFRLADCDLRSVGRNKELTVYITLYNDHYVLQDMEVKRMWQLEDTYCDYVGAPCNYCLTIFGETRVLYTKEVVDGKIQS